MKHALRGVLVWLAIWGGRASADTPGVDVLSARLTELQAEVAERRRTLEELRAPNAELEALRARRAALAEAVISAELERRALEARLAVAEAEAERAVGGRDAAEEIWASAEASLVTLLDQVAIYARELPGHEAVEAGALAAQRDVEGGEVAAACAWVEAAVDRLDREGQTVTQRQLTLQTAAGRREQVELLSVGHVAFAYRVGDRLGVCVPSPADASGHRWREDLPPEVAGAWRALFDASPGLHWLPHDPAHQLTSSSEASATLWERVAAGGPVMWPLGVIALLGLCLLLERVWVLGIREGCDPGLVERLSSAEDVTGALMTGRRSLAQRTVQAAWERREGGREAMEDAAHDRLLRELPRLERSLRGLGVLAAVSPLLGLLGTVTGIIATFSVIRQVGTTDPAMLAGGISQALITTATGLTIAIPLLLAHTAARGRVDRILADAEGQAFAVIGRLGPQETRRG